MLGQVDEALAALPRTGVAIRSSSRFRGVSRLPARCRPRPGQNDSAADRQAGPARAAFEFGARHSALSQDMRRWRETDRHEFFHHAENRPRAVRYALYEDAQCYDSAACVVDTPALVFQGRRDTVVDPDMVQRFGASRPAMSVRMLDDDHQLGSSLDLMWREIAAFLGLCE
jgi:pimeloyl-ACP methyl ester carboxylesterase